LYLKRNEFIYYYRILNNYETDQQELTLVRFSLLTKQSLDLSTTIIKREDVNVYNFGRGKVPAKKPFGITAVAFQEKSGDQIL
jgi:hypothetical protein